MEHVVTVIFDEEEAKLLNHALAILKRHGAKVTPSSFIKKEALVRAEVVLKGKGEASS